MKAKQSIVHVERNQSAGMANYHRTDDVKPLFSSYMLLTVVILHSIDRGQGFDTLCIFSWCNKYFEWPLNMHGNAEILTPESREKPAEAMSGVRKVILCPSPSCPSFSLLYTTCLERCYGILLFKIIKLDFGDALKSAKHCINNHSQQITRTYKRPDFPSASFRHSYLVSFIGWLYFRSGARGCDVILWSLLYIIMMYIILMSTSMLFCFVFCRCGCSRDCSLSALPPRRQRADRVSSSPREF